MVKRRKLLGALLTPAFAAGIATGRGSAAAPRPAPEPPWPEESDPDYWDRIRDQFYIPRGEAFFNVGTIGAVPRAVLERVIEDMRTLEATVTRWVSGLQRLCFRRDRYCTLPWPKMPKCRIWQGGFR